MRCRLPILPVVALCLLLGGIVAAQDEAPAAPDNPPPLGDVARTLRKSKAQQPPSQQPVRTVIDNENLSQVMEDVHKAKLVPADKTVFSIDPAGNTIKVSSPDVTCSLSFNSQATSLLVKPVLVEDLPLTELVKLDGPASIQDEKLQLEVFNGTDWELREITVGLTLERSPGNDAKVAANARVIPAAQTNAAATVERRSDVTLLYHLKASAKPFSTTAFRENIGITPAPDEDWRWSIVAAKGIRTSQAQPASNSPR